MDKNTVRRALALHFAALAESNDDRWPNKPPSQMLLDLEREDDALLDHLSNMERIHRR